MVDTLFKNYEKKWSFRIFYNRGLIFGVYGRGDGFNNLFCF